MEGRGISVADALQVLASCEAIELYPDDTPFPSSLLLGWVRERALHVVAARDEANNVTYVITVYAPDPSEWNADFKVRRSP